MPRKTKKTTIKEATIKKTKTVLYDVAQQLRTPEEIAAYLDAWLAEAPEDVAGIARALGDIARAKGMAQVARDAGLRRESLYKALGQNGNPSLATILKVTRAIGLRLRLSPRDGLRRLDGLRADVRKGVDQLDRGEGRPLDVRGTKARLRRDLGAKEPRRAK